MEQDTCAAATASVDCTYYEDEILWSRMCPGCGAAYGMDDILLADKNPDGGPKGDGVVSYSYFTKTLTNTEALGQPRNEYYWYSSYYRYGPTEFCIRPSR